MDPANKLTATALNLLFIEKLVQQLLHLVQFTEKLVHHSCFERFFEVNPFSELTLLF